MSSVPSRNTSSPAASGLVECRGYIVLDHAEGPDRARQLAGADEAYRASCAVEDRPYAAAILGPETAEVVLDMSPCSWPLCGVCLDKALAVIAHYPDGPTRPPCVGPGLIRAVGVSRLVASFLARDLVGDAVDCRTLHGPGRHRRARPEASRAVATRDSGTFGGSRAPVSSSR